MIVLFVLAVSLMSGVIYNLITGGTTANILLGTCISVVYLTAFLIMMHEKKQRAVFMRWLRQNRNEIYAGTAKYKGCRIDQNTEITVFEASFAFMIFSTKVPSRFSCGMM